MTDLILHIGTHKTATTSIQHCCALNRGLLADFGYYYPVPSTSSYVFNDLASDIAFGKSHKTQDKFLKYAEEAEAERINKVLVSGESFYSMTGLFYIVHNRPVSDYWAEEEKSIAAVRECTKNFKTVKIKIVFRPQDDLAASLYNQTIKNSLGYSYTYADFLSRMKYVFDYDRHLLLWEKHFGANNISVSYMSKQDAVKEFFQDMLDDNQITQLVQEQFSSNERLSRDVMETKKIFNATMPDRALGFMAARIFRKLSDQYPDKSGDQVFAPLEKRQIFGKQFEQGNKDIAERYGLPTILSTLTNVREETYSGLTAARRKEIETAFYKELNSSAAQAELFARRLIRKLSEHEWLNRSFVNPLRQANNYLRLRISGW